MICTGSRRETAHRDLQLYFQHDQRDLCLDPRTPGQNTEPPTQKKCQRHQILKHENNRRFQEANYIAKDNRDHAFTTIKL